MPRTPKTSASAPAYRPYGPTPSSMDRTGHDLSVKSESAETKADLPSPTKSSRKWRPEELTQLFEYVSKHGTSLGNKGWAEAVPGRTGNQSYQTWLQSLSPFIKKAIAARK